LYELDPLSEDAVRGTIEARAWAGDRSGALKAYAAYEVRLARELGAKPGADLQRMADLLREGRRSPAARPRAVGEPVARAERRFEAETVIGREREFSVLYDAWLAARNRAPAIVVLTGDPGLGKTTLTNAFVSTCQLEGAVVARAQAYDAERELPFAVLAELVRQLAIQRAIGCAEPEALSELSRLTPEVCAQFPGVPKPVEWAAEIVPLRLADAFLKTVTAAAEESPVVLVVDDIHAADNASAAILHMVARKLAPTRLLMILAARSTELRGSSTPAALTSDPTIEALRTMDLEPLPDESASRLVERARAAAGDGAAELPLTRILRAGRGNPLALELLTREWVTHGPESLLRDLEAVNTQPAAAIGIPRAITVVFERQVTRLDAKTRGVLDLAAVLGRRLGDLALYEAVDCTPSEAAKGLGRLRDEGFVREVHGDLEFRNELIRAQAYYAIPVAGRQYLHRRVGEFGALRTRDPAEYLEIAWHFLRAGLTQDAVPFAIDGAAGALSAGAPYEAQRILSEFVRRAGPASLPLPGQLLYARALLGQSRADLAKPILDTIASDPGLSAHDLAVILSMRAQAEYLLHLDAGTPYRDAAQAALDAARNAGGPELVTRALFEYARSGTETGDENRMRLALAAVEDLLQNGAVATLAAAHYVRAYCQLSCFDAVGATESMNVAVSLLGDNANPVERSRYCTGLGNCRYYSCDLQGGLKAHLEALELATKIGDDSRASVISANIVAVMCDLGEYGEAMVYGKRSVQLGIRAPSQPHLASAFVNLAIVHFTIGDSRTAHELLDAADEYAKKNPNWRAPIATQLQRADFALKSGNIALALDLIATAEAAAHGRERCMPDMTGLFLRLRVFRAAQTLGPSEGMALAQHALGLFRNRHPAFYLDALAALAFVERLAYGRQSASTEDELRQYRAFGLPGKWADLRAEGFLT
jgi:tetratricopeptide (TPR) repeat protein